MKIRILSYEQFKLEKQQILSVLRAWEKTDKDFFSEHYLEKHNSNLHAHWRSSIKAMLEFLQVALPQEKDKIFEQKGFAFFIAEENNAVQGIALCEGVNIYQNKGGFFETTSQQLYGIKSGSYFEINDLIIAATPMLSCCFRNEYLPHESIGKELLKAIIKQVKTLEKAHPILVQPHFNDEYAHKFFSKYLFKQRCGSMGHSFSLNEANFDYVINGNLTKIAKAENTLLIEDYTDPQKYETPTNISPFIIEDYTPPTIS